MGNGLAKCIHCLTTGNHRRRRRRRHDTAAVVSEPYFSEEGLGHSFCYVRPEPSHLSSSKVHHHEETTTSVTSSTNTTTSSSATTFRSISGASVSANTSTTPLSDFPSASASAITAAFDCSDSFASIPLQPIPRLLSGPLSGPLERGFMSGPIERGFMSGPIDPRAGVATGIFSGPLDHHKTTNRFFQRSFSHGGSTKPSVIRGLRRVIARTISLGQNTVVAPIKSNKESDVVENDTTGASSSGGEQSVDSEDGFDGQNLQWAQGKAGEDRVHVVISEEHGWVFVGIYDGFNGPDAPDYLLSNLYPSVQRELKGLLWEDKLYGNDHPSPVSSPGTDRNDDTAIAVHSPGVAATKGKSSKKKSTGAAKKWQENQRRWKSEWDKERLELDRKLKEQLANSAVTEGTANHAEVLKALSQALRKTEESFLDVADNMVSENPELALMGSCVLVMLLKGEDVYLMNVGDSRAVLARKPEPDVWSSIGRERQDLERINEEECCYDQDEMDGFPCLAAIQLTLDHSTCIEEEVQRIWKEHPDDSSAVTNDRVKGSLKVTRAFGAGFLKQPKWNDALLEMFQIDYVGTSPYITCNPSLWHHKLGLRDRFLILSSDGLYQYFTNEEAVAEVELFIAAYPDGDPAQHLVEEVLFRAARKAGMDFHELLEIPQGDRRRYHDDVSIIVISLEGRIWRSSV